jgi:hypothetical protein
MPVIKRLCMLCVAAAAVLAPAAAAQQSLPVSLDASLGLRIGSGGTYVERTSVAADLLLGVNLGRSGAGTLVGAVTAGVQGAMARDLSCQLGPGGECVPAFPVLLSAGAMVGVSRPSAWGFTTRALAGPAYFRGEEQSGALGLQGRLDVATPAILHTSLVVSFRGTLLPDFRGETLGTTSLGLGLRVH